METPIEFVAELIRKTDLVLTYRIDGREVRVPPLQVQRGSVTMPGQRPSAGTLTFATLRQ